MCLYRNICSPLAASGTQHSKAKATCHPAGLLGHGWQSSVCCANNMLPVLSGVNRDTSFKPAPARRICQAPFLLGAEHDSI